MGGATQRRMNWPSELSYELRKERAAEIAVVHHDNDISLTFSEMFEQSLATQNVSVETS